MSGEEWRGVPGFDGVYEVSSAGRVRRVRPASGTWTGKILKPSLNSGYPRVVLCRDGLKPKGYQVHRLVAFAFLGAPGPGMEVNHKNKDRGDARVENLEWVTRSENLRHSADKRRTGSARTGRVPPPPLNEFQIRVIRRLAGRVDGRRLAKMMGTSPATVCRIQRSSVGPSGACACGKPAGHAGRHDGKVVEFDAACERCARPMRAVLYASKRDRRLCGVNGCVSRGVVAGGRP